MLQKGTPESLYNQVTSLIREKLYAKEWGVNDRIPSEHELMKMLGVSRGTVQKGIEALVNEGLLERKRGLGTFVARPLLQHPSGRSLLSFAESLSQQGYEFETEVLEQRIVKADSLSGEKLDLRPGEDDVLLLRRVRRVDGETVILMESKINLRVCAGLERLDYSHRTLFSAIEMTSGKSISYGRARYGACVAGEERASHLGCEADAPVLNIDQVIYLEDDTPIEWGNMWLPSNRYVLTTTMMR